MFKVHYQEAHRELIDPVAKLVVDEAMERFNARWKTRCEAEIYAWLRSRGPWLRVRIPADIKNAG